MRKCKPSRQARWKRASEERLTGPADAKQKDRVASESSHSLIKKHRLWEIATFFFVMFLSPASFVFGLFLGISPEAWLAAYLKYVVVFITLSFFVALGGLEVATSYWLISHGGWGSPEVVVTRGVTKIERAWLVPPFYLGCATILTF